MALPAAADRAKERQGLLSSLLASVKGCQVRFGGRQGELATQETEVVSDLCEALEAVLSHGAKQPQETSLLGQGLARLHGEQPPRGSFWPFLKEFLNRQELERFYLLKNVNTDLGRCRAWIRSSLNEHSLERYLLSMVSEAEKLGKHCEPWAFLRDGERSSMLSSMAAGLSSILFAINIDQKDLNVRRERQAEIVAQVKEDKKESPEGEEGKEKKRKKRKVPSQVVSFDDSEEGSESPPDRSDSASANSFVSAASTASAAAAANSTSSQNKYSNSSRKSLERQILISQTHGKMKSTHRSGSSPENNLDFAPLALEKGKSEVGGGADANAAESDDDDDEMEDIYSRGSPESGSLASFDGRLERGHEARSSGGKKSSSAQLTPMKNSGIGGLIPVALGRATSTPAAAAAGTQNSESELQSEDSMSVKSYGEESDYASACLSFSGSRSSQQGAAAAAAAARSHRTASSVQSSSAQGASTLSREELKQALLSVMERKDELQSQLESLKKVLNQEIASSASVKEELAEEKRQHGEYRDKQGIKVQTLGRENELLKHQLKKYVGAVQKLRDGPQAYETLAQLERKRSEGGEGGSKYVDYHYEASEYEKKLIQVAEMHGELIEFNEHLQRTVQAKDAAIHRMREELVDLRGPLPAEDAEDAASEPDNVSVASLPAVTARALLHIWIPSVFLQGSGSKTHHVYQVYLRIKDEEWNIYRRYSDFYALHRDLRKQEKQVEAFDFPPKKSVGYKSEKVVEDRRKRLQGYLRRIVNLLVQTNPSLAAKPTKDNVLLLMPFFAENAMAPAAPTPRQTRSQSQPRSIFNRRRSNHVTATPQLAL